MFLFYFFYCLTYYYESDESSFFFATYFYSSLGAFNYYKNYYVAVYSSSSLSSFRLTPDAKKYHLSDEPTIFFFIKYPYTIHFSISNILLSLVILAKNS